MGSRGLWGSATWTQQLSGWIRIYFCERNGGGSIADLGAGNGAYSQKWSDKGFDVACYDGNSAIHEMSKGLCSQVDLSAAQDIPAADWAVSFETAEHIPKEHEDTFLSNLIKAGKKGIIMSWAHEGQGGTGHFNEENQQYVNDKMQSLGFEIDQAATDRFRAEQGDHQDCGMNQAVLQNNLSVFRKVMSRWLMKCFQLFIPKRKLRENKD